MNKAKDLGKKKHQKQKNWLLQEPRRKDMRSEMKAEDGEERDWVTTLEVELMEFGE